MKHKYTITIETDHEIVPGNRNHFAQLFSNPANYPLIHSIELEKDNT